MPLRRLTPDRMSCFTIDFPLFGTTEYPQAPFAVAKISPYWVPLLSYPVPTVDMALVPLLSYPVSMPITHCMHDPGSIVPHI
jgi:hypothetical protein